MAEKDRTRMQSKEALQQRSMFCVSLAFLVVLIQLSSASSWNRRPIRLGVQSSQLGSSRWTHQNNSKRRSFLALNNNKRPVVQGPEKEESEEAVYAAATTTTTTTTTTTEDSLYDDDEEWFALFPQEDDEYYENQINPSAAAAAARRRRRTTTTMAGSSIGSTMTRTSFEARGGGGGFRQSMNLPAFLTRRRKEDDEIISSEDYEEAYVVPVAAISVSSKVSGQQASFSSGLQGSRHQSPPRSSATTTARPEPTLNLRKEASNMKKTQMKASSASAGGTGRPLVFWENMICGAISRSVAQTVMHPANTMKTLLQQSNSPPLQDFMKPSALPVLFRGAGANFVLSVPHGAINFAVLEMVRKKLSNLVNQRTKYNEERIGPALDFCSSAISTICCSVVSTPQMMITDNIMAGNYPNLPQAVRGLASQGNGIQGFYARGWLPGLVGKIPSYALTWTFFQQLKLAQQKLSGRDSTNLENSVMGCVASATTVTIMMPLDTIKTRLVTQAVGPGTVPYKGIVDCGVRVMKEEGFKSFYKGLQPRLISVVPMIGIQFTVYEFMKRVMQQRALAEQQQPQPVQPKPILSMKTRKKKNKKEDSSAGDFDPYSSLEQLQESCMEVAASPEHPYPAPHFLRIMRRKNGKDKNKKAG